jgi:hypothetical protein
MRQCKLAPGDLVQLQECWLAVLAVLGGATHAPVTVIGVVLSVKFLGTDIGYTVEVMSQGRGELWPEHAWLLVSAEERPDGALLVENGEE